MTDFRISHLCERQSDPFFRRIYRRVRRCFPVKVPMRLARLTDGVVFAFFAIAEAVEYDQKYRGLRP
jgi:hypothetical protein